MKRSIIISSLIILVLSTLSCPDGNGYYAFDMWTSGEPYSIPPQVVIMMDDGETGFQSSPLTVNGTVTTFSKSSGQEVIIYVYVYDEDGFYGDVSADLYYSSVESSVLSSTSIASGITSIDYEGKWGEIQFSFSASSISGTGEMYFGCSFSDYSSGSLGTSDTTDFLKLTFN